MKRLLKWLSLSMFGAAIVKELRKSDRTWHGKVGGVIPYDFRRPTAARFKAAWWDPSNPHLFTPRDWGAGWAINFARLFKRTA